MLALRADAGTLAWRSTNGVTLRSPTPPVIADGLVIAGAGFGALIAHHLSDGSLAWRSQAPPRPLRGDSQFLPILTVADGAVYAAASPDTIAAWRVADGSLLWQSPSLNPTTNPTDESSYPYPQIPEPVVAGQVVYFVARNAVYAIGVTDGSLLWSTPVLPTPGLPKPLRYAPPVIADGRLFMVVADGSLYALNAATGAVLWHAPDPDLASSPNAYAPPANFAPPIVRDGVVYYAPLDGIRALAAGAGHLLWHLSTEGSQRIALAVAGGVAYIASNIALRSFTSTGQSFTSTGGALLALNARTGALRWKGAIQPGRDLVGVAVLVNGGAVYTISTGNGDPEFTPAPGVVAAWTASKGLPLWQRAIQSPSPDFRPVVFADGVIYLSTDGAPDLPAGCGGIRIQPTISALRATDGALLWQASAPAA